MPPKRHPKYLHFSVLFLIRFLFKNEPQNGAQNGPGDPLFFTHFSHVVPNLVLGVTFVHFWTTFGPPRLHFGFIWVPFLAPKASILVPTAYVLEFLDNPFLEQNTSHTDSGTWYPRPMF